MRLEFNPRALCYNLYCDTREEYVKMKQLLEKPLTATAIKSIDNMIYADTDSIKRPIGYDISQEERRYLENDVIVTKHCLNSLYGKVVTDMTKEYIVVHRDKKPMIIFTKSVTAVEKETNGTAVIHCIGNDEYWTDDKYVDVIKQLI